MTGLHWFGLTPE